MINNHLKGTRQYFQALLYYRKSKKKEIDKFHRTTENYKLLVEDLLADLIISKKIKDGDNIELIVSDGNIQVKGD